MEEPNLSYINNIAKGNDDFKNEFIVMVSDELNDDIKEYYNHLEKEDLKMTKVYVHRIKHKMSILSLEKSYEITNNYENNLRDHNFEGQEYFESMLPVMVNFLNLLKK